MRFAILGLVQTGKSSLFRILCGPQVATESYGLHPGVAQVPDERLEALARIYHPRKITHATLEFLDAPALVNDPEKDTAVISEVRGADAFVHVVRLFGDSPAPAHDLAALETQFLVMDHDSVTKRVERIEKDLMKARSKELESEKKVLDKAREALSAEQPLRSVLWTPEEEKRLRGFMLLSAKPLLVVLNAPEEDAPILESVPERCGVAGWKEQPKVEVTEICGTIEAELAELDAADAAEFLASYGLKESARGRLMDAAQHLLGLIAVFTGGERECRAWLTRSGTTAIEVAEMIHTDIARRFIKAEVVAVPELVRWGGMAGAREQGCVRLESKDHVVHDGDVVYIRHSA